MSATVYTTAGGRRFHADRLCWALGNGAMTASYLAAEAWNYGGAGIPLYNTREVDSEAAARAGYTACRVCVPPTLALPATGETYGHEPVTETDPWGWPLPVCARCTEPGLWYGPLNNLRPGHVTWPCMSAVVLGLFVSDADRWNRRYPVGTPVDAYPGARWDEPLRTRTRTPAWRLGHGDSVVSVDGYAGGIALTHVDPRGGA